MEVSTMFSESLGYKVGDIECNEALYGLLDPKFLVDLTKDGWIKSIKFKNNAKFYDTLNLVNCFSCSIKTRQKCLICVIEKNNHDCTI